MFGDDLTDGAPAFRVCCGPRCGIEVGHRRIYAAVETAVRDLCGAATTTVLPTMCQGLCGSGVTLVLPGGEKIKLRAPFEAREIIATLGG